MVERINENVKKKASLIRFLLLDVDGTLTEGQIFLSENGEFFKSFNVKDGMGIHLAQREGIKIGLISGRCSDIVDIRANELKIEYVWQNVNDKMEVFERILREFSLVAAEVAFMGDDINDLGLLKVVGLSASPADAAQEVKNAVDYVSEKQGGRGAVREFIDLIRHQKNKTV